MTLTRPTPSAGVAVDRLLPALAAATFLQWFAASVTLPLLPTWLGQRGASDLAIGVAMGAFFAGALVAQYPLGRLSDRIPPRTLLIGCVAGYAVASALFLLPLGAGAVIAVRAVQGAAAGATEVLALSIVGKQRATSRRTRGYAVIFAAQMSGMAVGPLLAGAAGTGRMDQLFLLAVAAAVAAGLPLIRLRAGSSVESAPAERGPRIALAALRPVLAAAVITGLISGVYEACWTLLLDERGATAWQIGLSWSLFCVPFVAVSLFAGPVIDRLDPRLLTLTTLACSVLLVAAYPLLRSVPLIIALGAVEGAVTALAYPAAQTLLARNAPPGRLGHAQGSIATAQTAAVATAAAAGGALFAVAAWLPFLAAGMIGAGLLAVGWRHRSGAPATRSRTRFQRCW